MCAGQLVLQGAVPVSGTTFLRLVRKSVCQCSLPKKTLLSGMTVSAISTGFFWQSFWPSFTAFCGQTSTQPPQATHFSVSTVAR